MRTRTIVAFLSAALIAPSALFVVGCEKELEHEKTVERNPDGTGKVEEKTVTQKPDGTVVTEKEKKVDNTPDR